MIETPTLGALQSPADYRKIYISQLGLSDEVPSSYHIDIADLDVWNQKRIGACVGHAMAKYKQKLDQIDTKTVLRPSARFLYAIAKARDSYPGEGTYPSLVAKILKDIGCATEDTCPNNTDLGHEEYVYLRDEKNIPKSAMDEAYKAKIGGYAFVAKDALSIKQAIYFATGCATLVRLGKEWWTDKEGNRTYDADKLCPMRIPAEIISGHEIWLTGYETHADDDLKIYFLNSWGPEWCNRGEGWFLLSEYQKYIDEMITFTDIPNALLEEAHNKPKEFTHQFTKTLKFGDKNDEVKFLQEALSMTKDFDYEITGYFGPITQKALFDFQLRECTLNWYEKYVLRGSICGPKSLLALNKLFNKSI